MTINIMTKRKLQKIDDGKLHNPQIISGVSREDICSIFTVWVLGAAEKQAWCFTGGSSIDF